VASASKYEIESHETKKENKKKNLCSLEYHALKTCKGARTSIIDLALSGGEFP
jgi:hypothetical protein